MVELEEDALSLSCPELDLCSVWIAAERDKEEKNEGNLEREERKISLSHTCEDSPSDRSTAECRRNKNIIKNLKGKAKEETFGPHAIPSFIPPSLSPTCED